MNSYSGTKHLEVMGDAVNYNAYLCDLVITHALPGDYILDFGAGIGTFSHALKTKGYAVSCVEPDAAQLERITAHGITGYQYLLNAPSSAYDYIFTLNVLEHIEDDQGTLLDLAGKLKLGGRLLIYVPAFQMLFSRMDTVVGHFRRYSLEDLSNKVTLAGFEIQNACYVDSIGFFAALLYKYIGRDDGSINRRSIVIFDRFLFPLSRILDRMTNKLFGKNLLLIAVRT
jgi:SAM-dependent methyltransferase